MRSFAKGAKAKSTVHCYERVFGKFVSWSESRKEQFLPASEITVALFLHSKVQEGKSFSTVLQYFSSISWKHKFEGYRDPTKSSLCKEILEAAKRHCSKVPSRKKQHLSVPQVIKIVSALGSSLQDLREKAWLLLAYAGFLRNQEFRKLKANDIIMPKKLAAGVVMNLNIRSSKTDQHCKGREIHILCSTKVTCPVTALHNYMLAFDIEPAQDVVLFQKLIKVNKQYVPSGKPLSYATVRSLFKSMLIRADIRSESYGLHSLRAGGATTASQNGASAELIKRHGRWVSDSSKDRYVHFSATQKSTIGTILGI